ncbi:MAG: Unknown protein [uncultured Sulfurovum sp.]|uniref:Lipoprotein n=1 Tax=uncultured Sulfurovum sp. TaxID=269237 RepID=A0A6S6S7W1_9BACT|nr:MAG: Unknown protein [uncultured Sulfurovum sp.]
MKTLIKISILLLSVAILLQGCGGGGDNPTTYVTTLGDGTSITTTDEGAVMAPNHNTLKSIAQEIATAVKTNVSALNEKEFISFTKETNYCDISGSRESQESTSSQKISSEQSYENCQEETSLQHGRVKIDYLDINDEGKYPKSLSIVIQEAYTFNQIQLKKELTIESKIFYYNDNSIQKITLMINGLVNYKNSNYGLQNIDQSILY